HLSAPARRDPSRCSADQGVSGRRRTMPYDSPVPSLDRRRFLVATLSAAGGLAVGVVLPGRAGAFPLGPDPSDKAVPGDAREINAWIVVEPDDSVIIRVAQSEMGEGVFTSMPMIVAEELCCDWTKVRAEYASANRNVVENNVYQRMGTGG